MLSSSADAATKAFFFKLISKHNSRKGNAESLAVLEETVSSARAQVTTCVSFYACFLQTRRNSFYIEALLPLHSNTRTMHNTRPKWHWLVILQKKVDLTIF